jgi:hypothetical protein
MNFLTEKLAGMHPISIERKGLPPINQNEPLCILANECKDYLTLQSSLDRGEAPDEDLMDQYHELCTHPSEEVQERFCGNYEKIQMALVQGAEEILKNWSLVHNRPIMKNSCYLVEKGGLY